MSVSVVVPARDAAARIPATVRALRAQSIPCEVVVVDDASRDDTAAAARAAGADVVVRGTGAGSYAARNAGVAAAHGDVLGFTDADCLPAPAWLERAVACLDATGADLVAGRVEMPLSDRPTTAELLDVARHLDQRRNVESSHFGATANLVVRRAALEQLGGFNPHLRSGGDLELGQRARAAGLRLVLADDAVVVHPPRRTAREVAAKAHRLGRSRAALATHGHPSLPPRPAFWRRPGAWLPGALLRRAPVYGEERLRAIGVRTPRLRLALGEWLLIQLPLVSGDVVGDWRARRGRR